MPSAKKATPGDRESRGVPDKRLTAKQQLFVEHYMATKNATKAAELAGYGGNYPTLRAIASENLAKPNIQAEVRARMEEMKRNLAITPEDVLMRLMKIHNKCLEEEAVLDRKGNPTGFFKFDSSGATRSIELVGKHYGMWEKKPDGGPGDGEAARGTFRERVQGALSRVKGRA